MSILHFVVIFDKGEYWPTPRMNADGSIQTEDESFLLTLRYHFEYVDKLVLKGKILTGGPAPIIDHSNQKLLSELEGAVIVYTADSLQEVQLTINDDPLIKEGFIQVKSIIPFIAGLSS